MVENTMTPEQQRIAIAEACGWKECKHKGYEGFWMPSDYVYEQSPYNKLKKAEELPNYLSDLNAMHEAEKILNDVQRRKYAMMIHQITDAGFSFGRPENYWICIHATAAQRAEAFLKTIGKWIE